MEKLQGYTAYYHEYRCTVEVLDNGWRARVYHMPSQEWLCEENVSGPTVGKDTAITLAVLAEDPRATREVIAVAKASLKWGHHIP
jgi:hypothetical protein